MLSCLRSAPLDMWRAVASIACAYLINRLHVAVLRFSLVLCVWSVLLYTRADLRVGLRAGLFCSILDGQSRWRFNGGDAVVLTWRDLALSRDGLAL